MVYFQLSNLQQQRILVEQLSREAAMQRISVSQAILDIKVIKEKYILEEIMLLIFSTKVWKKKYFFLLSLQKFISDRETDDYLLVGFPSQKTNPFREKSSCLVL